MDSIFLLLDEKDNDDVDDDEHVGDGVDLILLSLEFSLAELDEMDSVAISATVSGRSLDRV